MNGDMNPIFMKYKSEIKGLAIIWIVFFHMQFHFTNSILDFIKGIGYGGVDILTLLSGYGVSLSLSKRSISEYMVRRGERILPLYFLFLIPYSAIRARYLGMTIQEIFGNITVIGFFLGMKNQFNWYLSLLAITYIIAPFIVIIKSKRMYFILAIWMVLSGIACFETDYLMIVSRLPIFLMGIICYKIMRKDKLQFIIRYHKIKIFLVSLLIFLVGLCFLYYCFYNRIDLLWNKGIYWYSFILITPGLLMLLGLLFDLANKSIIGSMFARVFKSVGLASWEIFLFHVLMFDTICLGLQMSNVRWFMVGFLSILVGIVINQSIKKFLDMYQNRKQNFVV